MFFKRRNSHFSDEELSAYLDGELASGRLSIAVSHLDTCGQCSATLDALSETKSLIARLPEVEVPRSFVLTPQMAGMQPRYVAPSRRSPFVFAPAVALTLLVALFAVDLVSTGTSSRDESGLSGQAMVAENAKSSASSANDSAERATTGGPITGQETAPATPAGVIPPPSTAGAGGAILPTPAQPALAPSTSGLAGTPIVPPATGPGPTPTTFFAPPTPPIAAAPSTGGPTITSQADAASNTGDDDSFRNAGSPASADGGTDCLLIAELLAAIAFVVSLAAVFGLGLLRKGN